MGKGEGGGSGSFLCLVASENLRISQDEVVGVWGYLYPL